MEVGLLLSCLGPLLISFTYVPHALLHYQKFIQAIKSQSSMLVRLSSYPMLSFTNIWWKLPGRGNHAFLRSSSLSKDERPSSWIFLRLAVVLPKAKTKCDDESGIAKMALRVAAYLASPNQWIEDEKQIAWCWNWCYLRWLLFGEGG